MNRVRLSLQILLPVLVLLGGWGVMKWLASQKEPPEAVAPRAPAPLVRVIEVEPRDATLDVSAQGTVVATTQSALVAEVSGRVVHVSDDLVNGGFVDEGEVLIRIDPRDYELAVSQAKLAVAQADLRLARERADAEVARAEWEDMVGEGEPSPLTLREPQLAEAEANLDAAHASLERAQLDLERTEIAAPFAARVREKMVDIGQYVTRGQTLATAYGTASAEVRLPLASEDLAFLELPLARAKHPAGGPRVDIRTDFAGRRHGWTGRIVRTEGEIDPRTRMVVAVARVDDPYSTDADPQRVPLAVGMFVDASIEGRAFQDVIVLPRGALRDDRTVYTVDAESLLRVRRVDLVRAEHDEVVLSGGIPPGERVIVSPLEVATDGMRVRVEGSTDGTEEADAAEGAPGDADASASGTAAAVDR